MTRRFFIEGLTLDLPLRRDGVTGQAILDYGPVIDHPLHPGRPAHSADHRGRLPPRPTWRRGGGLRRLPPLRPVPGTPAGGVQERETPRPGAPNPNPEEERP